MIFARIFLTTIAVYINLWFMSWLLGSVIGIAGNNPEFKGLRRCRRALFRFKYLNYPRKGAWIPKRKRALAFAFAYSFLEGLLWMIIRRPE